MARVAEALVASVLGRLLIGRVTGEAVAADAWPLLDWRWLFALPVAALLMVMVEMLANPTAFD